MYPRYYPQRQPTRAPSHHSRDVVPRELAAQIAKERDALFEELQRTQQAYKQSQQERAQLARQIQNSRQRTHDLARAETGQHARIEELERQLAQALEERDAARYTTELLEQSIAPLEQQIEEATEERDAAREDSTDSFQDIRELVEGMLELRDSIERASAMSQDASNPWKQGLDHMVRQFDDILTAHGWTTLGQPGDLFDPEIHEAVGVHDAPDAEEITIHEVTRQGFQHEASGEILRPAQVTVAK